MEEGLIIYSPEVDNGCLVYETDSGYNIGTKLVRGLLEAVDSPKEFFESKEKMKAKVIPVDELNLRVEKA